MLNMDERSPVEAIGVDEETDQSLRTDDLRKAESTVADQPGSWQTVSRQAAGLLTGAGREAGGKSSLISRLQEKKAEVSAAVRHPEVRMKAEPAL